MARSTGLNLNLELDFQNSLWELVHSMRNRLPIKESGLQQNLTAAIHDLETLKGCAEILSFKELARVCDDMSSVVLAGLQGDAPTEVISRNLLVHLDQSLLILCSTSRAA